DARRDMLGLTRVHRWWNANVMPAQDLQTAQLVARAGNGLRFVDAVNAYHLELTHHGQAEKSDGRPNARDDGVKRFDRFALIVQSRIAGANVDVELQRVENLDVVAPLACRLDQDPRTVERLVP